jgi:hypothetical protein
LNLFSEISIGKFVSPETALKVLENGSLQWSRPDAFNDPFDSQPRFKVVDNPTLAKELVQEEFHRVMREGAFSTDTSKPSARVIIKLRNEILDQRMTVYEAEAAFNSLCDDILQMSDHEPLRFRTGFQRLLEGSKVLCLTKSFTSIPMWSYYASNHHGCLLIFEPISSDSQFRIAEPIEYRNDLPPIFEARELATELTAQVHPTLDERAEAMVRRFIFTKSIDWQHENEWRIYGGDGFQPASKTELNQFEPTDLVSVVFGCRAAAKFVKSTQGQLKKRYPSATVFKSEMSDSKIELVFHQL